MVDRRRSCRVFNCVSASSMANRSTWVARAAILSGWLNHDECAGSPCRASANPSAPGHRVGQRRLPAQPTRQGRSSPHPRRSATQHLRQDFPRYAVVIHHQHTQALEQGAGLFHQLTPVRLGLLCTWSCTVKPMVVPWPGCESSIQMRPPIV